MKRTDSNIHNGINALLKKRLRFDDLIALLFVGGAFFCYRGHAVERLNEVFLSLTGKELLGRNMLIQTVVIGGFILLCAALFILWNRLCAKETARPFTNAVTALIAAMPFALFLVLCANQTLRRDDYWEIAEAVRYGFWGVQEYDFHVYNGRFLSWFLKSLYAVFDPIPYIDIVLFLNLLLLFAGWYLLADAIFPTKDRLRSLLLGICGMAGSVLLASNIFEVWFWGSGTMVYGVAISLTVLAFALVLRLVRRTDSPKSALIPAALCCFLACGGSELCSASLFAFLFYTIIWLRVSRKKWDGRVIFLFVEVCLILAAVLLLSGSVNLAGGHVNANANEGASGLQTIMERLPRAVSWALGSVWEFALIRWKYWLVYLTAFFLLGIGSGFSAKERKRFVIAAALLVVTANAATLINAIVNYMPPRILTVSMCWLLGAGALLAFALGSLLPKPASRSLWTIAAVMICLTAGQLYHNEIDTARTVRADWDRRDAELAPLKDSGEDVISCGLPCPGSSGMDIFPDPTSEYNQAAAKYYGFASISAPEKCVDVWWREENGGEE